MRKQKWKENAAVGGLEKLSEKIRQVRAFLRVENLTNFENSGQKTVKFL
jgi:hypothetical protein